MAGGNQVINKSIHFVTGTYSYIDLFLSSNMSFKRDHAVEQSIFEKCHHKILFGTLDLNVPPLPIYYREIWDYRNAGTESIQKEISNFDWSKAFRNKNTKWKL